jgi:orotate phosphoribosyltransferase
LGNTTSVYLNGANLISFQVKVAVVAGAAIVASKIGFIHAFGIAGIPWATSISFSLVAGIPLFLFIRKHLRTLGTNPVTAPATQAA